MSLNPMLLAIPVVVQGGLVVFDDLTFHRQRKLGRFERVGHALDTLTVIGPLLWTLGREPTQGNLVVFGLLALLSGLFITKDEAVHRAECGLAESWLHSVAFVLHPVAMGAMGLLWWLSPSQPRAALLLDVEILGLVAFLIWEIVYWNLLPGPAWKEFAAERRPRATPNHRSGWSRRPSQPGSSGALP